MLLCRWRLAGALAWKHWLFKEPLLKAFCAKNGKDFHQLTFSEKAMFTKKATRRFSKKKMAEVIDQTIRDELTLLKNKLKPETRKEFLNKQVSMGVEREIGIVPFDLAAMYAWYENVDREIHGDSLPFAQETNELFQLVAQIKDNQEKIGQLTQKIGTLEQITDALKKDATISSSDLHSLATSIIDGISDQQVKSALAKILENGLFFDPSVLDGIKNTILQRSINVAKDVSTRLKLTFNNLLQRSKDNYDDYKVLGSKELGNPYSNLARKMLDIFMYHMGQSQSLGHLVKSDSLGEYALQSTSGNFKNPYRVNLRESSELFKNLFFDPTISAPIHITIGWHEDAVEREVHLTEDKVVPEASVLHFALIASTLGDKKTVDLYRKENEKFQTQEKRDGVVSSFKDTGRGLLIRRRWDQATKTFFVAVEFRGFSPEPGVDQVRFFSSIGNLGTAMKSYLFVEQMQSENKQPDAIDLALAQIWVDFRQKVELIYGQYGDIPPLTNANRWLKTVSDIDSQTTSKENPEFSQEKTTRFYQKLSEEQHKENGLVAQMKQLIVQTTQQIEAVFKEPSELISEPSSEIQPTPPTP